MKQMKDFDPFIQKMRLALLRKLPGEHAQMQMAPLARREQMNRIADNTNAIPSSVLILFYPEKGEIKIPFIKRPEYDGVHSGQIALPGGKYESADLTLQATALREAQEEVGIHPGQVKIIGNLTTLYIPPSRFQVLPVVGYADKKPDFVIQKSEVDRLIRISVEELLDEGNLQEKEILPGAGDRLKVPCLFIQGHIIWGATAMIMSELIEVIKRAKLSDDLPE